MKILITSDWYTPAVNGVVTSILNLKKGLEEQGNEVRVLTLSETHHTYVEGEVTYVGSLSLSFVYQGARLIAALALKPIHDIIKWHPDVIHSNCEFSTFVLAHAISKICGAPIVHTYHTVYEDYTHYFSPSEKVGRALVKNFTRLIAKGTKCIIAPTKKTADLLEGYGVKCPVYIVPTGIEPKEANAENQIDVRKKYNIPENTTLLLYLGRLAKEKNVDELLNYVAESNESNIMLMLVGDGPARGELESLTKKLGIEDKVVFVGMVAPDTVKTYYDAADLFVSASTSETQGLTYMEALYSGVPLLCREDDCLDGVLVNGENGWSFTDNDSFKTALDEFINGAVPRQELKTNALNTGKRYSVESFAQEADDIYKTVTGK